MQTCFASFKIIKRAKCLAAVKKANKCLSGCPETFLGYITSGGFKGALGLGVVALPLN